MSIEKHWLLVVVIAAFAAPVFAADDKADPVKTITPTETISADQAVPFPVDI